MEVPKNLVEAVSRLEPKAILLLDTNILMNPPRLDSYEIAALGRFLLVVPRVVYNELMAIKLGPRDKESVRKAFRALKVLDNLYELDDPVNGIDIGNGRWLITTDTPPTPNDITVEDRQVQKNLGTVDAALLRLADACSRNLLDPPTLLVTGDKNLTGVARSQGLIVCQLSSLRSPGALKDLLIDDDTFLLLDPDEERSVKIEMTLEELRSGGDYLIASGIGHLTYDDERYWFRWTFPYRNIGMAWEARVAEERDEHSDARFPGNWRPYYGDDPFWDILGGVVMPLENVDFMGEGERIPEPARRLVCSMLESAAGYEGQLHPPHVHVRLVLSFLMSMEWGPHNSTYFEELRCQGLKSQEEADVYTDLCERHNQHVRSLLDGTVESFGGTYRRAFELREALNAQLGEELEEDGVLRELAPGLASLLDDALDAWSVGGTREEEFTYHPFEWLQEAEEPQEAEEDHEEEATGE